MVHRIDFGGVTLSADSSTLRWALMPGVDPYQSQITVFADRLPEMWPSLAGSPQTLTIYANRDAPDQVGSDSLVIRNLWLMHYDYASEGDYEVARMTVADCRWKWCHIGTTGRHNHIIRLNDADIINDGITPAVAGQETRQQQPAGEAEARPDVRDGRVVGFKPADVIGDFIQLPRRNWRDLTINPDGTPRTALQMAMGLLNGYDVKLLNGGTVHVDGILDELDGPAEIENGLTDNKYPLNRINWLATDVREALAVCLAFARARLYAGIDGKIALFPTELNTPPQLPSIPSQEISGRLFQKDYRVWRPKAVHTHFRMERTIVAYSRSEDATATQPVGGSSPVPQPDDDNRPIELELLEPVVKLPANYTIDLGDGNGPQEFAQGTWLPEEKAAMAVIGRDIKWINESWFVGIESRYALEKSIDPNLIPEAELMFCRAIRECHRSCYRVHSDWIRQIIDMRAESVVVLDPITGKRMPSRVWADHTALYSQRLGNPANAMIDHILYRDKRYAKQGGTAKPTDDAVPSPFICLVLDAEVGIVQIKPVTDMYGYINKILTGFVKDKDKLVAVATGNSDVALEARFTEEFGCAAELVVESMEPNTDAQLYRVRVEAGEVNATPGIVVDHKDVMVYDETARFDRDGDLVNRRAVETRADAEAKMVYYSWQDRIVGKQTFSGLHNIKPFGTVKQIEWTIGADGFPDTTVDAPEPRSPLTIEHLLPPDLLHQRLKLLPPQS
jgi:hypothetical protein